jgi:diguanylate cyclase (GGDEF)-like protein/PAS domain S-box-containing protein
MAFSPPANLLLEAFLSDPEEAVIGFGLDGNIFLWNHSAESLYGYPEPEALGKSVTVLHPLYELPSLDALLHSPRLVEPFTEVLAERLHKSGVRVAVRMQRSLIRNPQGELLGVLERGRLVSLGDTVAIAETHLGLLVERMPLFFWTTDKQLRVTSHCGRRLALARGLPRHPVGQSIQQYLRCPEDGESPVKEHHLALRGIASRFEYSSRNRVYDVSVQPHRDPQGTITGCIGSALDITERRKSEEEIHYRATHDGLTGLANYREFFESLEREISRAGRTRLPFALLLLDLDDLKAINDRFGHLTGNRALNRLARVMKDQCRATEMAARYGGDEFAILLLDADGERAQNVADRIRNALRVQTDSPALSVSIGLSVYPDDGLSAAELLESADKRLYKSKKSHRRGETLADKPHPQVASS